MDLELQTREMIVARHAVPALEKAVARLVRAAKRLNLSPLPELVVHWDKLGERSVQSVTVLKEAGERPVETSHPPVMVEVVPATMTLPDTGSIRAEGKWRMVGWVTKTDLGMETDACHVEDLPRLVPYKSSGQYCDHCSTKRNRIRTMVIEDTEHGVLKQVGCECATHYLTDLQGTLAAIEFRELVVDVIHFGGEDEDVWGGGGASALRAWETEVVLAHCAASVRANGGYAKSRIEYDCDSSEPNPCATWRRALSSLSDPEPPRLTEIERKSFDAVETGVLEGGISVGELDETVRDALMHEWARAKDKDEAHAKWAVRQTNPDDLEVARRMVDWIESAAIDPAKDEFLARIRDLVATGYVSERKIALLAAIWPCRSVWEREQKRREMEAARSEPAPEGRVPVEGEVLSKKEHFSDFGPSWKLTIQLDNGCRVWCSEPAALNCKPGDRVKITATWKRSDRDQFFAFGSRPVVTSEKPAKRSRKVDIATAEMHLTAA